jgi:hypothetical protein
MTTQAQKNLIVSVIQMIRTDILSGHLSADQAESLEGQSECFFSLETSNFQSRFKRWKLATA